jgi:hypothetical protein
MTIQKKFGIAVVSALPENMRCSSDREQGAWTTRVRHQQEVKYYVEGRTAACRDRSPDVFERSKKE